MKKVFLLLAVAGLFTVTACNSKPKEAQAAEPVATEEVVAVEETTPVEVEEVVVEEVAPVEEAAK